MAKNVAVTGVERFFGEDEIIVSKTDIRGRITYANSVFLKIADYTEKEVVGQPHSLIRHPHMPRAIFKLLWDSLEAKKELFAYVMNRTKFGDHYWVFAHATPTFDANGQVTGYHSSRRVPDRKPLENAIIPLYRQLKAEEERHANDKDGLAASTAMLQKTFKDRGMDYAQFIFAL